MQQQLWRKDARDKSLHRTYVQISPILLSDETYSDNPRGSEQIQKDA